MELMRRLLAEGESVTSADSYLDTPLHKAAARGRVDACKLLLVSGAPASAANVYGWTALHYACAAGCVDAARLLLVWGASADAAEQRGDTSLHVAAFTGHTATVQLLLAWGASTEVARSGGVTPLHWAAQQGHARVVELLAERGARADSRDAGGDLPLHAACRAGRVAASRSLILVARASLLAAGAGGDSPLHCATSSPELVSLLLAEAQAQGVLPRLLAAVDGSGMSALRRARAEGAEACAQLLLSAGASTDSSAGVGAFAQPPPQPPQREVSREAMEAAGPLIAPLPPTEDEHAPQPVAVLPVPAEASVEAPATDASEEPVEAATVFAHPASEPEPAQEDAAPEPAAPEAAAPEVMAEAMPEAAPDAVLEEVVEVEEAAAPEAMPEAAPESVLELMLEEEQAEVFLERAEAAGTGSGSDGEDGERGWDGEAGPFESLVLRLASRALSRLNDRVGSAGEFERALALELAGDGVSFASAQIGRGFRMAGGLLLLSEPPGSVEQCIVRLQAAMAEEPELETVGVVHLCPVEGVDARFLSRGEEVD